MEIMLHLPGNLSCYKEFWKPTGCHADCLSLPQGLINIYLLLSWCLIFIQSLLFQILCHTHTTEKDGFQRVLSLDRQVERLWDNTELRAMRNMNKRSRLYDTQLTVHCLKAHPPRLPAPEGNLHHHCVIDILQNSGPKIDNTLHDYWPN